MRPGDRREGTIREKSKFAEVRRPDGSLERPSFSRYSIAFTQEAQEDVSIDDADLIERDRTSFTKHIIGCFIQDNATREAWNSAPWLVKDTVADQMRIDRQVPPHLQQVTKATKRKSAPDQTHDSQDPAGLNFLLNPPGPSDPKSFSKASKKKKKKKKATQRKTSLHHRRALGVDEHHDQGSIPKGAGAVHHAASDIGFTKDIDDSSKPQAPSPIKYPIDDLEVSPTRDGTHRPSMKYLSQDLPNGADNPFQLYGIKMRSVGPLLETWNTMNVFCQVLFLDSFTFDDYLECLHVTTATVECELFTEIHCALLKLLVEDESDGGEILVTLPDFPEEGTVDEERSEIGGDLSSPQRQQQPGSKTSGPVSSACVSNDTESPESRPNRVNGANSHRASEVMGDLDWIQRLQKRDFRHGGWEIIVVGLLHRLSLHPKHKVSCDEVLSHLVPANMEPSQETVQAQYAELDINLRVKILQMLCLLTVDLKSIRGEMESNNELMTEVRKEKMEWQRSRKTA